MTGWRCEWAGLRWHGWDCVDVRDKGGSAACAGDTTLVVYQCRQVTAWLLVTTFLILLVSYF